MQRGKIHKKPDKSGWVVFKIIVLVWFFIFILALVRRLYFIFFKS
jgi:hypothetical protein